MTSCKSACLIGKYSNKLFQKTYVGHQSIVLESPFSCWVHLILGSSFLYFTEFKASWNLFLHGQGLTKGWIGTNYRRLLELEAFSLRVGLFSVPVISPIIPNVRCTAQRELANAFLHVLCHIALILLHLESLKTSKINRIRSKIILMFTPIATNISQVGLVSQK